jgi:hypothetical protein
LPPLLVWRACSYFLLVYYLFSIQTSLYFFPQIRFLMTVSHFIWIVILLSL